MARRRGRRRKKLLDNLKENRGYWKLKEAVGTRSIWRGGFARGYEAVVRHATG